MRGPTPVVFYGEIPSTNGKPTAVLKSFPIPGGEGNPDFFCMDGSPRFGALMAEYPA